MHVKPLATHLEFTLRSKINNACSTLQPEGRDVRLDWTASSTDQIFIGYRKWIYPNRHYNCWGVTPKVAVTGGGFAVTLKQHS